MTMVTLLPPPEREVTSTGCCQLANDLAYIYTTLGT